MDALFVLTDVSPSNRNTLTTIEVTDSMKEAAACATSVAETSDADADATVSPCDDSVTGNCVNILMKSHSTNVATPTPAPVHSERRNSIL